MPSTLTAEAALTYLAGTLTPTTLAAILANLTDNDPIDQEEDYAHDVIVGALTRQLVALVGVRQAHELIDAA